MAEHKINCLGGENNNHGNSSYCCLVDCFPLINELDVKNLENYSFSRLSKTT
jgi:hypothetical protein